MAACSRRHCLGLPPLIGGYFPTQLTHKQHHYPSAGRIYSTWCILRTTSTLRLAALAPPSPVRRLAFAPAFLYYPYIHTHMHCRYCFRTICTAAATTERQRGCLGLPADGGRGGGGASPDGTIAAHLSTANQPQMQLASLC